MKKNAKPVYYAGHGFENSRGSRRLSRIPLAALVLVLLALLSWLVARELRIGAAGLRVRVLSDPPGARIWLDHRPTEHICPAELNLPALKPSLVQVRLEGWRAEPLARLVEPRSRAIIEPPLPLELGFRMRRTYIEIQAPDTAASAGGPQDPEERHPRSAGAPATVPAGDPELAAAQEGSLSTADPGPQIEELRIAPEANPAEPAAEQDPSPGRLHLAGWDELFRLRINNRELRPREGGLLELNPGPHRLVVDLYRTVLLDSALQVSAAEEIELRLPDRTAFVRVETAGAEGEIVSGDWNLGRGTALIPRSLLPLDLRFLPLPGLLEPPGMRIDRDTPLTVVAPYLPEIRLHYLPGGDDGGIELRQRGYFLPDQGFVADVERGPELDEDRLLLGRAYHDRRPGGAHEARFRFNLPEEFHRDLPARLLVEASDTGDNYPLSLLDRATLSLLLNGIVLAQDIELEREVRERSWPVNNYLEPGENLLVLRNTERSRSLSAVHRIAVELVE